MTERLKNVLTKLIHLDQKGFVKGRNISEANRIIQDIIQYADEENEEGIIVFLDQQKTFDRVEWGWVDFVLKTFNFGEKFRGCIQMLVKNATTSIKTNGFVSIFFSIFRSCRQGCPVAQLIYILQAEPMACAIRGNNDIVVKLLWFLDEPNLNVYFLVNKGNNKLPNSEQSYKGKVKTHNYINRQNQSTTGKL